MSGRAALVLLGGLVCAGGAGCGSEGPFEYVPVSGRLVYEDGAPIPAQGVRLQFFVQDVAPVEGAHPRPGAAMLDEQGSFASATSYRYADGLTPGRHRVSIDYATDAEGKLLVPREYVHASTTPLEVVIDAAGGPPVLDLRVPRPKTGR